MTISRLPVPNLSITTTQVRTELGAGTMSPELGHLA